MADQQKGYIPKAVTQREIETGFLAIYRILGAPTLASMATMTLLEFNSLITDATLTDQHNSLFNLDGGTSGEYYHFTQTQHTRLNPISAYIATLISAANAAAARGTLDATGGRAALTLNNVPRADASGDLVDSSISDDGTLVTITRNVTAKSIIRTISTLTANTTLDDTYDLIICKTNGFTVTLPTIASIPAGRPFELKNAKSNTNNIILDGDGSELVDNALTQTITPGVAVVATHDDTEWHLH